MNTPPAPAGPPLASALAAINALLPPPPPPLLDTVSAVCEAVVRHLRTLLTPEQAAALDALGRPRPLPEWAANIRLYSPVPADLLEALHARRR